MRVHHPEHAADTEDLVEATDFLPHRREQHHAGEPCVLIGLVNSEVDSDFARPKLTPCLFTEPQSGAPQELFGPPKEALAVCPFEC